MPALASTPYQPSGRILTGRFREKNGYSTYRPDGTKDWLLIYTIRGAGDFGCRGTGGKVNRVVSSPGDVTLIPPGEVHDYLTDERVGKWDLLWAHFFPRPEWTAWLRWPHAVFRCPGLLRLTAQDRGVRKRIEDALSKMNRLAVGPHDLRQNFAMNALEEALLWLATQMPREPGHDPRVAQAEEYLCQHLRENVRLDDLAEVVGLSVSRLSHLFRKQTGVSPQRYYEVQRMERARQLLEMTAMPVKQIAGEVGFENPFYFTLRFKRHTGKSPREYRRGK